MRESDQDKKRKKQIYMMKPAPEPQKDAQKAPAYKRADDEAGPDAANAAQEPPKGGGNRRRNVLIVGLAVLLVACVSLAIILPGCNQKPVEASSASESVSESEAPVSVVTESGYDKDALVLSASEYGGTVLGKTDDAGDTYVKDTLFLGDSNTARMLEYSAVTKVTLNTSIGVEGMGIGGALSNYCVKFRNYSGAYNMAQAVAILQPRRVVITFGTNNAGGTSVDSFINTYGQVLDAIEESYPYAEIIIASVPPVAQVHMNQYITMNIIDGYNLALVELAKERGLKFLNWSENLKDGATGYMKAGYAVDDGIHISKAGMEAMFEYFRTHALDSEDERPKPLDPIPERLPIPRPVTSTAATPVTEDQGAASSSSSSSTSSSSSSSSSSQSQAPASSSAAAEPAPVPSSSSEAATPDPLPPEPTPVPSDPVVVPSEPVVVPDPVPSTPVVPDPNLPQDPVVI